MRDLLIKFAKKGKKEDFFHSSEYGKAQSGEKIGAVSIESFNARMRADKNRKIIQRYYSSRVAEQRFFGGSRAQQYIAPVKNKDLGVKKIEDNTAQKDKRLRDNSRKLSPISFKNRFSRKK